MSKSTRIEIVFSPANVDVARLRKSVFGDKDEEAVNDSSAKEEDEEKDDAEAEAENSGENTEDADQPADIEVPALEVHLPPSQEVTFDRANPPVLSEDGESVSPQEPQSMHTKWKIPCFVKETGERKKPRSPVCVLARCCSQLCA